MKPVVWLGALLALSGMGLAQSGNISGTVLGKDVAGTVMIACYLVDANCDEGQSKTATVGQKGSSAAYKITELGAGPFLIIAWRDLNQSGEIDAGDEVGIYSKDGKTPSLVPPSSQKIDLRLVAFDGNTDALLNPSPAANPHSSSADQKNNQGANSGLVGEWHSGSPSPTTYYNAATGEWAPTSGTFADYKFFPDGRYEYNGLLQTTLFSCTTTVFIHKEGVYKTNGTTLMLQDKTGQIKSQDNCNKSFNYDRPAKLNSESYTWRVGLDPDLLPTVQTLYLWLTGSDGNQLRYARADQ